MLAPVLSEGWVRESHVRTKTASFLGQDSYPYPVPGDSESIIGCIGRMVHPPGFGSGKGILILFLDALQFEEVDIGLRLILLNQPADSLVHEE